MHGKKVRHPEGRRAIFVGDLVDRGPAIPEVLRLAMDMVASGTALCVQGNHESQLLRKLAGRDVKITHGLAETLAQLVRREPLRCVHECVFGVLALESEPVDPRL